MDKVDDILECPHLGKSDQRESDIVGVGPWVALPVERKHFRGEDHAIVVHSESRNNCGRSTASISQIVRRVTYISSIFLFASPGPTTPSPASLSDYLSFKANPRECESTTSPSFLLGGGLLAAVNAQTYTERYRPQYHFTPAKNWMNDPNGLIYHKGKYHLYFQHNPTGDVWGNMSWGHAVSRDLMHWEELPVALSAFDTPPSGRLSEFFFSGSTVYDKNRSSGFGSRGRAPLVAAYTAYFPNDVTLPNNQTVLGGTQAQSIACSSDDGLTWTEYEGNPVLPLPPAPYEDQWKEFRDPFVFWYEPGDHWVMAVALPQLHIILIYTSDNLKDWKYVSEFGPVNAIGGVWECPSLFPLPVNGKKSDLKWVMVIGINPGAPTFNGASGTQYMVGSFDGETFTGDDDSVYDPASGKANWLDFGPDFYAAATYNGLDNYERVAITWMSDWAYAGVTPTSPWRSAMTVPRALTLEKFNNKLRLMSSPHANLERLERGRPLYSKEWRSIDTSKMDLPVSGKALDITLTFSHGSNSRQLGVNVRASGNDEGAVIGYDFTIQQMFVSRNSPSDDSSFSTLYPGTYFAPLVAENGRVKLRILLDWSSVEVFGGRGESTITAQIFPSDSNTGVSLFSNGDAKNVKIQVEEVSSVW
jgi:levanase/fructan beta-fructosidase